LSDLDEIVEGVRRELAPEYTARLRAALAGKDKAWLVDELVRLIVERDLGVAPQRDVANPNVVDEEFIGRFVAEHAETKRDGFLLPAAPAKGTALLAPDHRTAAGEALLKQARAVLSSLLFGEGSNGVALDRVQQELLTVVLPRHKADSLDFLRASTEVEAVGTWHDPQDVSNDERADNVVLEVQFGEVESELVGTGVLAALRLINELEINEQVLYVRMVNVEETSLGQ
jgi:hypothetical protein